MVIDSLKHTEIYEKINPLFAKAFEYLKSVDLEKLEVGRINLEGDDLFIMVSDTDLRPKEEAKLEAHNQYIDIQIPINKSETFGWKGRREITSPIESFDTNRDIQFFDDQPASYFNVSPGNFTAFWPDDAHAPCIGEGTVRKIVVKIKIRK